MDNPRHRSPRFPFIALSKAIERTRQLWALRNVPQAPDVWDRKGSVDPLSLEQLATAWKYGAKSSGLAQTAAALMQFGLLSPKDAFSSRHFGLTSTSLALMSTSRWNSKARRLLRKVALMPKIHRELFTKFGGAAGEDDADIEHYLVHDLGLAGEAAFSASSARKLIKEYRATIKAAELSEIGPCSLPPEVFGSDNSSFFDFADSETETVFTPDLVASPKRGSPRTTKSAPRGLKNEHDERVLEEGVLSKTSKYRILVSGEIGQKEIELLIRRLEISKESLGKDK